VRGNVSFAVLVNRHLNVVIASQYVGRCRVLIDSNVKAAGSCVTGYVRSQEAVGRGADREYATRRKTSGLNRDRIRDHSGIDTDVRIGDLTGLERVGQEAERNRTTRHRPRTVRNRRNNRAKVPVEYHA